MKASLASRFSDDIDSYIVGKTEFVLGVLGKIGLSEEELGEIRRINQMDSQMDNVVRPNPASLQPPGFGGD